MAASYGARSGGCGGTGRLQELQGAAAGEVAAPGGDGHRRPPRQRRSDAGHRRSRCWAAAAPRSATCGPSWSSGCRGPRRSSERPAGDHQQVGGPGREQPGERLVGVVVLLGVVHDQHQPAAVDPGGREQCGQAVVTDDAGGRARRSASGDRRPQTPQTARASPSAAAPVRSASTMASSSVDCPRRGGPATRTCSPSYASSIAGSRSDSRMPTGSLPGLAAEVGDRPELGDRSPARAAARPPRLSGGGPGQRAATWATASGSDVDGDATWVCSLVSANTQRPATAAGANFTGTPAEA